MQFNKLFILGLATILSMGAYTESAIGLEIQVGPAQLSLQGPPGPANFQRNFFDRKICYAIENHARLELFIGSKDETSDKETKVTVKKITIDPYLFGIDPEGRPVLQGNVINSEVIKEVTITYSDAKYKNEDLQRRQKFQNNGRRGPQDNQDDQDNQDNGSQAAAQQDKKNPENNAKTGLNIANVSFIRVLDQTHFDVPKDIDKQLEKNTQGNIQVVCSLSSFSNQNQGQNQGQFQGQNRGQYQGQYRDQY